MIQFSFIADTRMYGLKLGKEDDQTYSDAYKDLIPLIHVKLCQQNVLLCSCGLLVREVGVCGVKGQIKASAQQKRGKSIQKRFWEKMGLPMSQCKPQSMSIEQVLLIVMIVIILSAQHCSIIIIIVMASLTCGLLK